MKKLLDLLVENGGIIVTTGTLSATEISLARDEGRMFVDENNLGFVWLAPDEVLIRQRLPEGITIERLEEHKNNQFNRDSIEVYASDVKQPDGANHQFQIDVWRPALTSDSEDECVMRCVLNFQNGGIKVVGPNGITDQALIAIILHRLRGFQSGKFSCRDNAIIITHLEEALDRMERRGRDRAARGVEGERIA